MITVIDYGMGNIRSVVKAVEKYTGDVQVTDDPAAVKTSTALIMPGDGAFGMAMENLRRLGWVEVLRQYIQAGGFFLGICLGFQLLFSSSEEFGLHEGLGVIKGKVTRFNDSGVKVPHMGWNIVALTRSSPLLENVPDRSYFYFIHSYYPAISDRDWTMGEVQYGVRFPCIVGKGNCIATQFHPEKSHNVGLRIIKNFVGCVCS